MSGVGRDEQVATGAVPPGRLTARSWRFALISSVRRFGQDQITDLAAAMTYYTVLSIFPFLMALISILNLVGRADVMVPAFEEMIGELAPAEVTDFVGRLIEQFLGSSGAGLGLVVAIVTALWSSSNYVAAFRRAMNRVYQVSEGRNFIVQRVIQLVVTLVMVVSVLLILAGLTLSQPVTRWLIDELNFPEVTLRVWVWLRWPLIAAVAIVLLALLYYLTPNVRQPRLRWVTIGSLIAIMIAVAAAWGFALYLSVFDGTASYTRTYGALAGVIIALFFTWLINSALVFGGMLDCELERARQLQSGMPAENALLLPPRSDPQTAKGLAAQAKVTAQATEIRREAIAAGARPPAWYHYELADLPADDPLRELAARQDQPRRAVPAATTDPRDPGGRPHPGAELAGRMLRRAQP